MEGTPYRLAQGLPVGDRLEDESCSEMRRTRSRTLRPSAGQPADGLDLHGRERRLESDFVEGPEEGSDPGRETSPATLTWLSERTSSAARPSALLAAASRPGAGLASVAVGRGRTPAPSRWKGAPSPRRAPSRPPAPGRPPSRRAPSRRGWRRRGRAPPAPRRRPRGPCRRPPLPHLAPGVRSGPGRHGAGGVGDVGEHHGALAGAGEVREERAEHGERAGAVALLHPEEAHVVRQRGQARVVGAVLVEGAAGAAPRLVHRAGEGGQHEQVVEGYPAAECSACRRAARSARTYKRCAAA